MQKIFEIKVGIHTAIIPEEALYLLDGRFNTAEATNATIRERLNSTITDKFPGWAAVCLDRSYKLLGHIAEVRPKRSLIPVNTLSSRVTAYISETFMPPAEIINFASKEIAESVAGKSPLFEATWNLLKDLDSRKRWLCFCDPLPAEWATMMEQQDDKALLKLIHIHEDWAKSHQNWEPEPTYDMAIWDKIMSALAAGNSADALHLSVTMQENNPCSMHADFCMALAYQEMGMLDLAIEHYEKVQANSKTPLPKSPSPPSKIACPSVIKIGKKIRTSEMRQLHERLFISALALERIGDIQMERGDREKAISAWKDATATYPFAIDPQKKLAHLFIYSDEMEKAKEICLNLCKEKPMDYKSWIMLGQTLLCSQAYREACHAFNKAYQLDVSSFEANYYLGAAQINYAHQEQVEPFRDKQLKFPFDVLSLYERGICHIIKSLRNDEQPPATWYLLGIAYFELRRYSKAAEAFAECVKLYPDEFGGWNNMAVSYSFAGDYDNAILASEKALSLAPEDGGSYDTMGLTQLRKGNTQNALYLLNKAVNLDPKNVDAYCNLAEAYIVSGDNQQAKDKYRIARYLAPVRTWRWILDHPELAAILTEAGHPAPDGDGVCTAINRSIEIFCDGNKEPKTEADTGNQ